MAASLKALSEYPLAPGHRGRPKDRRRPSARWSSLEAIPAAVFRGDIQGEHFRAGNACFLGSAVQSADADALAEAGQNAAVLHLQR